MHPQAHELGRVDRFLGALRTVSAEQWKHVYHARPSDDVCQKMGGVISRAHRVAGRGPHQDYLECLQRVYADVDLLSTPELSKAAAAIGDPDAAALMRHAVKEAAGALLVATMANWVEGENEYSPSKAARALYEAFEPAIPMRSLDRSA